jgi:hypothetical protein
MTSMTATATGEGAASTASDGAVYTGFGGGSSEPTDSPSSDDNSNGSARLVLNFGELYGLGVVATGVFVGFTTFL